MPVPQPGFFGERDRAFPPPGPNQKGCPSPRPFVNRAAPPVLVLALLVGSGSLAGWQESPLSQTGGFPFPLFSGSRLAPRTGDPPRATKVQQLLIFGVPPSPGEAAQGGGGLLPTSVRQGGSARFSLEFRVLSQKMGQKGLARECFPHFAGCFPTCYVNLAIFPLVIGNTSSRTPNFL